MKSAWLTVSVLLNVALAATLLYMLGFRDERPAPVFPTGRGNPEDQAQPAPGLSPPPPSSQGAAFHWSQVESTNYLDYIANLRAIGCPELTIRDIIVADVDSLFASRYAALTGTTPELAWWGRFDPQEPLRAALLVQLEALSEEKRQLLIRLLGPDAGEGLARAGLTVTAVREQTMFAFLPEAKRAAVRDLIQRYRALREWSRPHWKGLPSDERDAMEKALLEARDRDLAAILTPGEMSELNLRDSPTSDAIRERFGRGDLTEVEFRELYRLRRDFEQRNTQVQIEDWKELEGDYATALGPARFDELQRQNDGMWQALQDLAPESGVSSDAMSQALAIKQEYTDKLVQAVTRMFADPLRDPQPLRDLAAEMDARLATLLGADTIDQLDRLGVLPRLVIQDDGNQKRYSLTRGGFSE